MSENYARVPFSIHKFMCVCVFKCVRYMVAYNGVQHRRILQITGVRTHVDVLHEITHNRNGSCGVVLRFRAISNMLGRCWNWADREAPSSSCCWSTSYTVNQMTITVWFNSLRDARSNSSILAVVSMVILMHVAIYRLQHINWNPTAFKRRVQCGCKCLIFGKPATEDGGEMI